MNCISYLFGLRLFNEFQEQTNYVVASKNVFEYDSLVVSMERKVIFKSIKNLKLKKYYIAYNYFFLMQCSKKEKS